MHAKNPHLVYFYLNSTTLYVSMSCSKFIWFVFAIQLIKVGSFHLQMMGPDRYKNCVKRSMSLPINQAIVPEKRLKFVTLAGVPVNFPVLSYYGICVVTFQTLAEGYSTKITNTPTN